MISKKITPLILIFLLILNGCDESINLKQNIEKTNPPEKVELLKADYGDLSHNYLCEGEGDDSYTIRVKFNLGGSDSRYACQIFVDGKADMSDVESNPETGETYRAEFYHDDYHTVEKGIVEINTNEGWDIRKEHKVIICCWGEYGDSENRLCSKQKIIPVECS